MNIKKAIQWACKLTSVITRKEKLKIGDNAIYHSMRLVVLIEFDDNGNVWVDEYNKERHCVNLEHLTPITRNTYIPLDPKASWHCESTKETFHINDDGRWVNDNTGETMKEST